MHLICSYCRTHIGETEPLDDARLSHGMCGACAAHFDEVWSARDLTEYLDTFDEPVVAVDPEGRIMASNEAAAAFTGKGTERTTGFMGGEYMECQYARLPEGCGRTVHCAACTIRNTVDRARSTGEAQRRVAAGIDMDGGRVRLLISTYPESSFVRLVIEEVLGEDAAG